ncbi:hypothetical protein EIG75_06120 [Pseudomonas syringae]|uniref:Uncharacterized protein n=1 Tax=Pseudomonas syringae TaxID=317 RepID=A0A6B2B0A3_PSESX|nr:hypothetical protein ALO85_101090 [Pseudomonas syringae pv. aptata]MCF5651727.1 hypothetical protein [Pseudomonas syringae]RMP49253.1 hypothetical protein ALQ20_101941 [Pseudomonas syringae pv. atrofaciens]MCF5732656.1 hypothetical protein [Pseudomonas syringae]MCF5751744.1 hypothetical protein [Pseudomonas syringae]
MFAWSIHVISDRNRNPVIGLENGVTINRSSFRLAWRTLRFGKAEQLATEMAGVENLPVSTTGLATVLSPAMRLFDGCADMGLWDDDTYDLLIIRLPPDGSRSDTYRHLIRVARQGVIILR